MKKIVFLLLLCVLPACKTHREVSKTSESSDANMKDSLMLTTACYDSISIEERKSELTMITCSDDRILFSEGKGEIICRPDGSVLLNGVSSLSLKNVARSAAEETDKKTVETDKHDAYAERVSESAITSKLVEEKTASPDSLGLKCRWIVLIAFAVLAFIAALYLTNKP